MWGGGAPPALHDGPRNSRKVNEAEREAMRRTTAYSWRCRWGGGQPLPGIARAILDPLRADFRRPAATSAVRCESFHSHALDLQQPAFFVDAGDDDRQGWAVLAEYLLSYPRVFRAVPTVGEECRDLDEVLDSHPGRVEYVEDICPGQPALLGEVLRNCAVRCLGHLTADEEHSAGPVDHQALRVRLGEAADLGERHGSR